MNFEPRKVCAGFFGVFFFLHHSEGFLHDSEVKTQLSDVRVPETGTFDNITSSFYGIHFVYRLCFRADIN